MASAAERRQAWPLRGMPRARHLDCTFVLGETAGSAVAAKLPKRSRRHAIVIESGANRRLRQHAALPVSMTRLHHRRQRAKCGDAGRGGWPRLRKPVGSLSERSATVRTLVVEILPRHRGDARAPCRRQNGRAPASLASARGSQVAGSGMGPIILRTAANFDTIARFADGRS